MTTPIFATVVYPGDNTIKFYINGSFLNTASGASTIDTSIDQYFWMGDGGWGAWQGGLSRIKIYNRALSLDEILTIYNGEKNKYQ